MSVLVGIDLGTTNSALAVLDRTGRPEIIENAEGASITPSVVFLESGAEDVPVVGQAAKDHVPIFPDRVAQGFKRLMTSNQSLTCAGRTFSPIDLSALVLRKLTLDAAKRIGPIERAVITVPANFTNEARLATMSAGKRAGFEVTDIVNEPTAALLYYAREHEVGGTVVVYDFGGGTLDVTVAQVQGKDVRIVTSKGDPRLGGLDFDRRLDELVRARFEQEAGAPFDPEVHQMAKSIEEYKRQLSDRERVTVQITGGPTGRRVFEVTRAEFAAATRTLVTKSELLVESTLEEAGLLPQDVSGVYLVGGTTRMPMVREHLAKTFGFEPVCHANPDEVVALGAALHAGMRAGAEELNPAQATAVREMKLREVANHYFGTISLSSQPSGPPILRNVVMIDKNTPLPCSRTESYFTVAPGQAAVTCRVTQSASREQDPDFVRVIWEGDLGPLPPGRPAGMEIRVTYSYDVNQIMHCTFEDVDSGLRREARIGLGGDAQSTLPGADTFVVE